MNHGRDEGLVASLTVEDRDARMMMMVVVVVVMVVRVVN